MEVVLRTALSPGTEVDDCVSLAETAVAHLQHEKFQKLMVARDTGRMALALLIQSYSPQGSQQVTDMPTNMGRSPEDEQEYFTMRGSLIQALSDVSATAEFSAKYSSMDSPLIETLLGWLQASQSQLRMCSCVMLGNLARSDAICTIMISRLQIHTTLISLLGNESDSQVLHSALGLLRNLALPQRNKDVLGNANILASLARFWSPGAIPQVSHAAASVLRQVLIGSPNNIRRLLSSLSSDPESPAHSKTQFSLLLSLYDQSDDTSVKVEIARVLVAILRSIQSPTAQPGLASLEDLGNRFYALHQNVARPLAMMVSQSKWPIIRSEGWFAIALMARSVQGCKAIDAILHHVEVFGALEQAIHGQTGSTDSQTYMPGINEPSLPRGQETEMKAKNRENAMVLISEMLKNTVGPPSPSTFETTGIFVL